MRNYSYLALVILAVVKASATSAEEILKRGMKYGERRRVRYWLDHSEKRGLKAEPNIFERSYPEVDDEYVVVEQDSKDASGNTSSRRSSSSSKHLPSPTPTCDSSKSKSKSRQECIQGATTSPFSVAPLSVAPTRVPNAPVAIPLTKEPSLGVVPTRAPRPTAQVTGQITAEYAPVSEDPSLQEFGEAAGLTCSHIELFVENQLKMGAPLINFQGVACKAVAPGLKTNQIVYETTVLFSIDSTFIPSRENIALIMCISLQPTDVDPLLTALVANLPSSNPFSSIEEIVCGSALETVSPTTMLPTRSPTTLMPTYRPTSRRISVAPTIKHSTTVVTNEFVATYSPISNDPSLTDIFAAAALTCRHIEDAMLVTFGSGVPLLQVEEVTCIALDSVGKSKIRFEINSVFADKISSIVPSQNDIQTLLCSALQPFEAGPLIDGLTGLAASNPFRDSTVVRCNASRVTNAPSEAPTPRAPTSEISVAGLLKAIYSGSGSPNPTLSDFSATSGLTCAHIEDFATQVFSMGAPLVILESVSCAALSTGPDPSITFETMINFSDQSRIIPSQNDVDAVLCSSLQSSNAGSLIRDISLLPQSNPFRTAMTVDCELLDRTVTPIASGPIGSPMTNVFPSTSPVSSAPIQAASSPEATQPPTIIPSSIPLTPIPFPKSNSSASPFTSSPIPVPTSPEPTQPPTLIPKSTPVTSTLLPTTSPSASPAASASRPREPTQPPTLIPNSTPVTSTLLPTTSPSASPATSAPISQEPTQPPTSIPSSKTLTPTLLPTTSPNSIRTISPMPTTTELPSRAPTSASPIQTTSMPTAVSRAPTQSTASPSSRATTTVPTQSTLSPSSRATTTAPAQSTLSPSSRATTTAPTLSQVVISSAAPVTDTPTISPTTVGMVVAASPFGLIFHPSPDVTDQTDFEPVRKITCAHLEKALADIISLSPFVTFRGLRCTSSATSFDPKAKMLFDVSVTFDEDSQFIPSLESVDIIISVALLTPQVEDLITAMNALPLSNPFSSTMTVAYEVSPIIRLQSRTSSPSTSPTSYSPNPARPSLSPTRKPNGAPTEIPSAEILSVLPPTSSQVAASAPLPVPSVWSSTGTIPVATSFKVTYLGSLGDPSLFDLGQAVHATCVHIDGHLMSLFDLGSRFVDLDEIGCSATDVDGSGIVYAVSAIFSTASTIVPSASDLYDVIAATLVSPSVDDLIVDLIGLPTSNPFSHTTQVECATNLSTETFIDEVNATVGTVRYSFMGIVAVHAVLALYAIAKWGGRAKSRLHQCWCLTKHHPVSHHMNEKNTLFPFPIELANLDTATTARRCSQPDERN